MTMKLLFLNLVVCTNANIKLCSATDSQQLTTICAICEHAFVFDGLNATISSIVKVGNDAVQCDYATSFVDLLYAYENSNGTLIDSRTAGPDNKHNMP
ncbi:hypothetical protein J3R30DRAFT_3580674 [Lentinula aciculospora]|uniref:Uncharacterized protein n=1 Tax=Lentinula aciculospora TaxID=153920 RepID=A0A9W8ZW31_9AGAR|nr:hypothetical protein J3R30DRAFT_3589736 [Lentinula aciculospora]KAJ4467075.1 hypothetical protein J3R30DRAFT_3580674 [Lentinula aciculospora]